MLRQALEQAVEGIDHRRYLFWYVLSGDRVKQAGLPLLAGAVTPSETQALLEKGLRYQKFFPAERSGGVTYLDDIRGPLPEALFCPTGGINAENAGDYLERANCISVGGSFVIDGQAVKASDWEQVSRHAEAVLRKATGG